jgi:hypothetical protein
MHKDISRFFFGKLLSKNEFPLKNRLGMFEMKTCSDLMKWHFSRIFYIRKTSPSCYCMRRLLISHYYVDKTFILITIFYWTKTPLYSLIREYLQYFCVWSAALEFLYKNMIFISSDKETHRNIFERFKIKVHELCMAYQRISQDTTKTLSTRQKAQDKIIFQ